MWAHEFFTSTTVMTKYSSLKMFIVTYKVNHTLYMAHFFFLLNFVATTLTLPLFLSFFPFCFSFSPGRQYNSVNMTEGKTPLECRRVINIFLEEIDIVIFMATRLCQKTEARAACPRQKFSVLNS